MTTGTYSFVFAIFNIAPVGELSKTAGLSPCAGITSYFSMTVTAKFADQVKFKDTSQLIKGISKFLQKLLK